MQAPDFTQSFNRYSYAWGNPLIYTDRNGEFLLGLLTVWVGAKIAAILTPIITGAVVGAAVGAASYTVSVALSPGGFQNWNGGQFWKSVGLGALSGAVTAGIGNMFSGAGAFSNMAAYPKAFAKAYLHGFAQGGISVLGGGDFFQGFASGALGSLGAAGFKGIGGAFAESAIGQIGFGALAGGVGAWATGGEFWKGAVTGGIVAGLNDVLHDKLGGDPKSKTKLNKKELAKIAEQLGISMEAISAYDKAFGSSSKLIAKYGSIGTFLSLGGSMSYDLIEYKNGDISGYRFSFRLATTVITVAAGVGGSILATPATGWLVGQSLNYTGSMAENIIFDQLSPTMQSGTSKWYRRLTNKLMGLGNLR